MATPLDVYAAVHEAHGPSAVRDARFAARRMNASNGVAAFISSVISNIR